MEPVLLHPLLASGSLLLANLHKSTSPHFRKSDEFNTAIDIKLSNVTIAYLVSTQVCGGELSNSYSRDIYTHSRVDLATKPFNPMAPQLLNHGISAVDALNESSGI